MLSKFKHAFYSAFTGGVDPIHTLRDTDHSTDEKVLSQKYPYSRPHFLQLNLEEEIQVSADKSIRPIIVPRDIARLPWNSGYAEAVNAGKSIHNEDQACLCRAVLQHPEARDNTIRGTSLQSSDQFNPALCLPYVYFAIFDGHAGPGAAVAAANQLQYIIHEKLVDIIDHLLPPLDGSPSYQIEATTKKGFALWFPEKEVAKESLIIGALESAFGEMDNLIAEDRCKFSIKGGCTVLVALFILGKVYVANAGDSRAIMVKDQVAVPLSTDFSPETERSRIRHLATQQPHLLGGEFTPLDFMRRPLQNDLGKRVLYRDAFMTGWAYKTVTQEDLKIPVIQGEGKRSRVLATIGVTRGFGDHDLKALNFNIHIKPFLLSQPEVQVVNVESEDFSDSDVLVMGTDGLWDVTSNQKAADIMKTSLAHFPPSDSRRTKYRFTSAAQDLVMHSRGKSHERSWRTVEGRPASTDDISVFVIPLLPYKNEHASWKQAYDGIRDMYDTDKDTSAGYGKLSLKSSPVATQQVSPVLRRPTGSGTRPNSDLFTLGLPASPNSIIVMGHEEKPATATLLPNNTIKHGSPSQSQEAGPSKPRSGKSPRGSHMGSGIGAGLDAATKKKAATIITRAQVPIASNTTNEEATIMVGPSTVNADRGKIAIREIIEHTPQTTATPDNLSAVESISQPTSIPDKRQ